MNEQLLDLIRQSGYLTDANLADQVRYDLLTHSFWLKVADLGYDLPTLRRTLWRLSGHPEHELRSALSSSPISKAAKPTEGDPRKHIKETAAALALLYGRGEKEIDALIDLYIDSPDRLRTEVGRVRRRLLASAADWLSRAVPGLYLMGSGQAVLRGAHDQAARALATQEYNRWKEVDAQVGRHVEEVLAEAEKRKVKARLSGTKPDLKGIHEGIIGYITRDGKALSLAGYAAMLALTSSRDFFNLAAENQAYEDGRDLMRISREVRANSCQACRDWAGKIISISGRSLEYPSLEQARSENIFHPHCIHFLEPVNEDRYAGTGHYLGGTL